MVRKILPAITTLTLGGWQEKILEIDKLGLKEVAVFPTCLDFSERQKLYQALESTRLEEVPFVHLKSEMSAEEREYFVRRWRCEVFNLHNPKDYPIHETLRPFFSQTFMENTWLPFDENEMSKWAGVCLDFSHLEDCKRENNELYKNWFLFLEKYFIGCAHISAIKKESWFDNKNGNFFRYSYHEFNQLADFDYLKNYPLKYFPEIIALELENSLVEQLKAKEYIKNLLGF